MRRYVKPWALALAVAVTSACGKKDSTGPTPPPTPPYQGTIFIDPDIITPSDPTTLQTLTYAGQGSRTMFDRRVNGYVTVDAYLFDATFDDGLGTEFEVNPEFGSADSAQVLAQEYATVIGQLPTCLRQKVETVWVQGGTEPFGGGNDNLLIHVGQAQEYQAQGILAETLVHEATHTSLDPTVLSDPEWIAAQAADDTYISTYAQQNATREDDAESFLPYLALRYRAGRISKGMADTIQATIPHRIAYYDGLELAMHPID